MKACKICGDLQHGRGLCRKHYDAQPEQIKRRSLYNKKHAQQHNEACMESYYNKETGMNKFQTKQVMKWK